MAFQGDLRNIGLATVFQNLQQNDQSGTLHLKREKSERFVYIANGMIAMVSAGPGAETPLLEYLRRAGKAAPEEVEAAEKRRRKGQRLGSALEKGGAVTQEDVKRAVQQFVEEEAYELFTWPDGSFDFQEGDPADEAFDAESRNAKLTLDPNTLIVEAARRVDEWDRIDRVVGGMNEVYVLRRECAEDVEAKSDPRAQRVADLLDGTRDVEAVVRDSALGRYAVSKVLSQLITDRLVRPISADELRALAEQAESASNFEQAKTLLRRALDLERNDVELRRRLAGVLELAGEKGEAASEFKLLANSLLDRGRSGEAADCLRHAIDLMPNDVSTRERLFQILSDSGSMTVAIESGAALAHTYSSLGLNEKAKAALERMLSLNPKERMPLERKLVEADLALGDVKAAIQILRKMGRRHLKDHDYDEAACVYEEILKFDPKDEEARKRVAEIHAGIVERMLERRRALVRMGTIAAVGFPLLVFVVRELGVRPSETDARLVAGRSGQAAARLVGGAGAKMKAGRELEAARELARAALAFDDAAAVLEDFRARHFWTLASAWASREVSEWRRRAARTRISAAEVYKNNGLNREACDLLRSVSRSLKAPTSEASEAEELLKSYEALVGGARKDSR